MKKKNVTKLTLALASMLVTSALGSAFLVNNIAAADTATHTAATQALGEVFETSAATPAPQTIGEGETATKVAAYELSNGGSVKLKRNLALKWYEQKGAAEYVNVKFSFKDLNFSTVTLSMDTPSAWATPDEKTTNTIEFVKGEGDSLTAYVNPEKDNEGKITSAGQTIADKTGVLTLTLKETANDGEFTVVLGGEEMPTKFTNIGANYAEYKAKNNYPLAFEAKTADDKTTVVCIHEINGQKFTGVTDGGEVSDTAAPVLVVNETFDGFLLGTKFTFNASDEDYKIIDVLQSNNLKETKKYYQYNPTATKPEENKEKDAYSDLTTSTIFYTTSYQKTEGGDWTTVYKETEGVEYVSIYFELADDTYNQSSGDYQKALYHLSWYASEVGAEVDEKARLTDSVIAPPVAGGDWIYLNRNETAPTYNYITADDATKTNKVPDKESADETEKAKAEAYEQAMSDFVAAIQKQANEKYAGSNEDLQIPSVNWLMDDNNGYRAMQFSISYYTPTSTAGSPSSLTSKDFDELEIPVANEGWYEFKIFASDATGNAMQYYLDGELVTVTTSNVWDIDEIPSFTFEIKDLGLKVEELTSSKLRETEILDTTYTLPSSEMKVVGATNLKKSYVLYKVDYSQSDKLQSSALTQITYKEIADAVATKGFSTVEDKDYHSFYRRVYAELVAAELGLTATEDIDNIEKCFVPVGEQGDTVNNKTEDWEVYEWNSTSVSFKTAEEGEYLLFGDFWEGERPDYRAAAYKLIVVESKGYSVAGEDNWFEKNIVSVILFAIAGVMLVLIVILLMVKPSDETLEDVETKAEKKSKKAKKAKDEPQEENQDKE